MTLEGLGLTDEQKARLERTVEAYRQTIDSNSERLEKEETQFARLLEADPIDRGAFLTQLDRVIQARAEVERTNAAITLEMRDYLTHAQWMQLRPGQTLKLYGGEAFGARGGARGGRGQQ